MATLKTRYCSDCDRVVRKAGTCQACKRLGRVLRILHAGNVRDEPGKRLRIEFYRTVVECGGRLFE